MRRAAIEIQAELLCEVLPALRDAGIKIVETLRHPFPPGGLLLFIVEGFDLPPECDDARLMVSPIFTKETYGEQQIIKLSEMRAAGPYVSEEAFRSRESLDNPKRGQAPSMPTMLIKAKKVWSYEECERFRRAWDYSAKQRIPIVLDNSVEVFELRDGTYVRLGSDANEAAS